MNFCTGCNRVREGLRTDPTRCGICSRTFAFLPENATYVLVTAPDGQTFDLFAAPAEQPREIVVNRESKKGLVLAELEAALGGKTYRVTVDGITHTISGGWVPGTVLVELAGWRAVARLHDLKSDGVLEYESKHLAGSVHLFRATAIRARAA